MTPELTDLIARVLVATGPDWHLDEEVARACEWVAVQNGPHTSWKAPDREYAVSLPRFTASIDTALTLVPDGSFWNVMTGGRREGRYQAVVMPPTIATFMRCEPLDYTEAATPALALCAAALKARI